MGTFLLVATVSGIRNNFPRWVGKGIKPCLNCNHVKKKKKVMTCANWPRGRLCGRFILPVSRRLVGKSAVRFSTWWCKGHGAVALALGKSLRFSLVSVSTNGDSGVPQVDPPPKARKRGGITTFHSLQHSSPVLASQLLYKRGRALLLKEQTLKFE